jgi:hypothetical protein
VLAPARYVTVGRLADRTGTGVRLAERSSISQAAGDVSGRRMRAMCWRPR